MHFIGAETSYISLNLAIFGWLKYLEDEGSSILRGCMKSILKAFAGWNSCHNYQDL